MIEVRKLIWDNWNVAHIARHDVIPEEVEQACQSKTLVRDGHYGRLLVFGETHAGRILTIVLDPEPESGVYYPVTAYTTDKKGRQRYVEHKTQKGGKRDYDETT